MTPLRVALAAVVVVVMGIAIVGIGMGDAPKSDDAAPTGAKLVASKTRIAAGDAQVKEGRTEFKSEGCSSCHAIAADGYKGVLGPRLDADTDPAKEIRTAITDPRADIVKGYEANAKLMPINYGTKMSPDELDAVVAYIKAASGSAKKGS